MCANQRKLPPMVVKIRWPVEAHAAPCCAFNNLFGISQHSVQLSSSHGLDRCVIGTVQRNLVALVGRSANDFRMPLCRT